MGDDSESQQDLDNVLEVATDVAADTANIVRRFLDTAVGTYPPPINPAVPFVDEPPSPKGGPLTPTFRAPPPPKRGKQPPPPGPLALITYFQNILPMGVPSKTRCVAPLAGTGGVCRPYSTSRYPPGFGLKGRGGWRAFDPGHATGQEEGLMGKCQHPNGRSVDGLGG